MRTDYPPLGPNPTRKCATPGCIHRVMAMGTEPTWQSDIRCASCYDRRSSWNPEYDEVTVRFLLARSWNGQ